MKKFNRQNLKKIIKDQQTKLNFDSKICEKRINHYRHNITPEKEVTLKGNETKSVKVTITAAGAVVQDATARATGAGGMGIIGLALAFLIVANIVLFIVLFSRKKSKKVKK